MIYYPCVPIQPVGTPCLMQHLLDF